MNPQAVGIPGDPEQARRLSALFATVETRAQEIQSRLRAIDTGAGPADRNTNDHVTSGT